MGDRPASDRWWELGALALVAATAVALRCGTNILEGGAIFDERYIRVPIEDLMQRGWSVATAIDYTETKGPAFIWLYAALGSLLGGTLNDLRLISALAFAAGAAPLLLIARRSGLRGPALVLVAGFYMLLPHNAVLGQLLMSEPLFILGALWLMWFFLWGLGAEGEPEHRVLGPVLFGVMLSLLLHLRVHAVAFAAAAVLVAIERDRARAWPWIVACAAAGLSRLPLYLRWGGLVSPDYQSAHRLGLDLDAVTYMAAAMVPLTAVFLWTGVRQPRGRWIIAVCAGAGLLLALVASPSLDERMQILDLDVSRYMGLVWGAVRSASGDPLLRGVLVGVLAVAGAAGLGSLGACAWGRPPAPATGPGPAPGGGDARAAVERLQFWTLAVGCVLYGLTRSVVYDRYLLPWAVLLPVAWVGRLGRVALAIEGALLLLIQCRFVWRMLIQNHDQ